MTNKSSSCPSIPGPRSFYKKLINFYAKYPLAQSLYIWVILVIEVPITLLTLFALCVLIKSNRIASVYVINLIFSDLIQIICISLLPTKDDSDDLMGVYYYSLIAGLYFMACVAFERYLLVCHPHWYKSHHSLKLSCFVSLIIWFVPLIFADIKPPHLYFSDLPQTIACFIPYPIIILCFVGTCRGLSHSISLTPLKRRLILGSLFLVLLTYTCLILPFVILDFIDYFTCIDTMNMTFKKAERFLECLLYLNPLADCLLYLFMRADVGDIIKSVPCCCRTDRHQNSLRLTSSTNTQHVTQSAVN
ncbi:psychosine receptor-like [Labeo rohita]|uniref:psychosine receptor-like n=1 Tax=Labeo rohita TaxID=84645 RepID=UPI0021E33E79|nr:psychosine receptor-like [Labeo rohita]XP_050978653.1 psychosine receptor-like [Labeo rohita]